MNRLEITIKGEAKEIAALVREIQGRRSEVDDLPFNFCEEGRPEDFEPPHSKHSKPS